MTALAAPQADFWAPKRRLSLSQARRRSERVQVLRVAFAAVAAIAAGVLLGSMVVSAFSSPSDATKFLTDTEAVTMRNPRFTGRDAVGAPYMITADTAQRNGANAALIDLRNPALDDGFNGTIRAPSGIFDQDLQVLDLFEEVVLTDSAGNRFTSSGAKMYIEENRVVGNTPLVGEGPIGKVRADTYEIEDGGARIILTGNVWTEIQPGGGRQVAETGEENEMTP